MMFIPWFDVEHIAGDTSWIAALSVTIVNDDHERNVREIYSGGQVVKTKVSAAEIFERMGAAIEGARNAELEAMAQAGTEIPERNPEGGSTIVTDEAGITHGTLLDGRPFTIEGTRD
jgi:DNA integrity scanning protein DisA with diadenylate cyclase activity